MKTKLFLMAVIISLSFTVKSQSHVIQNDSIFFVFDFIPDTILEYNTATGYNESLSIDLNQDGIYDFNFYYLVKSGGYEDRYHNLTADCRYHMYHITDTIALNNPSIVWNSGSTFWLALDTLSVYFGIKIIDGSNNYYGWIKARIQLGRMIIDKYAFCKIPNYPLHLGQTEIVGIQEINAPEITHIYLANSGNTVIVYSGKTIKKVSVFNATGSLVASQQNVNATTANVSMAGLAHGTYLVQVVFGDMSSYARQVVK
jgi:hypothetical protein